VEAVQWVGWPQQFFTLGVHKHGCLKIPTGIRHALRQTNSASGAVTQQFFTPGARGTNVSMTEQLDCVAANDKTCGICLEEWKNPLKLLCGHSFCDGCLDEWRSRYGVKEEMRRKCPICRARIPPSREMVTILQGYRARKQRLENKNDTTSEKYREACQHLKAAEESVGADWDGVTVLQDNNYKPSVVMPDYIYNAVLKGGIKAVLRWINANRAEDRVNAVEASSEFMRCSTLTIASMIVAVGSSRLTFMTLLLQLGANVDHRNGQGGTAMSFAFYSDRLVSDTSSERIIRLLLGWGASFFNDKGCSRDDCIYQAMEGGASELADLLESELGGRRCEIVNLSSWPELNGKTCVADEYLPDSNQYKVTLETKSKEVLILDPKNLKRRDRTPEDCGYYIEFKNGRSIRHDFDLNKDCQAFIVALGRGETQPVVTEESEARAEQAAAELLAELGLDDWPIEKSSGGCARRRSPRRRKVARRRRNKH